MFSARNVYLLVVNFLQFFEVNENFNFFQQKRIIFLVVRGFCHIPYTIY